MSTIEERLEKLLAKLDQAPIGPNDPFGSQDEKDRYESFLWFAYRRRQAAQYHRSRVEKILEEYEKHVAELSPPSITSKSGTKIPTNATLSGTLDPEPLAYELSAFVEAIKSGLDFLATALSFHLKGVTTDKISTFIKLAKKGTAGPILDEVLGSLEWLTHIRQYRHHLIHRLLLLLDVSYKVSSHGSKVSKAFFPVAVPEETPKFAIDTRLTRWWNMEAELPPNVVLQESKGTVTYPDGTEEILEHSVSACPAPGYVPIQHFMGSEFDSFDSFLNSILDRLALEGIHLYETTPSGSAR